MSSLQYSTISCGVHQGLMGYGNVDVALIVKEWLSTMRTMDHVAGKRGGNDHSLPYPHPAFVVFSDTTGILYGQTQSKGQRMRDFIHKQGLGSVMVSQAADNPNTGSDIQVFVWQVNYQALRAWVKKGES